MIQLKKIASSNIFAFPIKNDMYSCTEFAVTLVLKEKYIKLLYILVSMCFNVFIILNSL